MALSIQKIYKISILSFCSLCLMGSFVFAAAQPKPQDDQKQSEEIQKETFKKRSGKSKKELKKQREFPKKEYHQSRAFPKKKMDQEKKWDLSDEQKEQWLKQKQDFRAATEGLRQEIHYTQKDLYQALDNEVFDAEKIKALHQKRHALKNQMKEQKAIYRAQKQELFGSEQMRDCPKMKAEKKEGRQYKGQKGQKDKKEFREKKKEKNQSKDNAN